MLGNPASATSAEDPLPDVLKLTVTIKRGIFLDGTRDTFPVDSNNLYHREMDLADKQSVCATEYIVQS